MQRLKCEFYEENFLSICNFPGRGKMSETKIIKIKIIGRNLDLVSSLFFCPVLELFRMFLLICDFIYPALGDEVY